MGSYDDAMSRDFFISHASSDIEVAQWIAHVLEADGYSCFILSWDFHAGSNVAVNIHNALIRSERIIAVLSSAYLQSPYCTSEWSAAYAQDPSGIDRKLIPVRVENCDPQGLLGGIVYVDLVGMDEKSAEQAVLSGAKQKRRGKPCIKPSFPPGNRRAVNPVPFL